MYDLKGKNAIVTGGAVGIGACYVRDMLKLGAAKCAILDANVANGEETAERLNAEFGEDRVRFFRCDVTEMSDFERAFDATTAAFGTVDVLINNAGVMNDGDWEREILINVNGVVHGTLLALRHMGKDRGGRGGTVVNIASILGLSPLAGCPVYVGTKHAVLGMTRSWGMPYHYAKTGVRFMNMCPGVTDTDLISGAGGRQLGDDASRECHRELSSLPAQPPAHVSQGMMHALANGESGSTWVCEGGQPVYEVDVPKRQDMRKKR